MLSPDKLLRDCKSASYALDEKNDCTVRAIAITTGEGYDMAHYAMEEHGRRKGKGAQLYAMKDACEALGYEMLKLHRDKWEDVAKTATTATKLQWPGRYIISFRGHVAAMVDGDIYDWVKGRRHRILDIYHIVKK